MDFIRLADSIASIDTSLRRAAVGSVNRMLTVRNWLIGGHIVEYEQRGEDRAKYGQGLMRGLAEKLSSGNRRGFSERNLLLFRNFYLAYPGLLPAIAAELQVLGQAGSPLFQIPQSSTAESQRVINQDVTTASTSPDALLQHFTFTHFVELMRVGDTLKRAFYEIEGIRGCWSVAQLKREIEGIYYTV